jgi:hypothetical protein
LKSSPAHVTTSNANFGCNIVPNDNSTDLKIYTMCLTIQPRCLQASKPNPKVECTDEERNKAHNHYKIGGKEMKYFCIHGARLMLD